MNCKGREEKKNSNSTFNVLNLLKYAKLRIFNQNQNSVSTESRRRIKTSIHWHARPLNTNPDAKEIKSKWKTKGHANDDDSLSS